MSDDNEKRKTAPPPPKTLWELLEGESKKVPPPAEPGESVVVLGEGCASLPEELLLAHGRGEVLFLAGAGISMSAPSNLPSFRDLVLEVYRRLDDPLLPCLRRIAKKKTEVPRQPPLTPGQRAEARNFRESRFDVVLGMLERRLDRVQTEESAMRRAVLGALRPKPMPEHGALHRNLIRLSARGRATTILTTNFDLLLEAAAEELSRPLETHSLGAIPRPAERHSFSGALHVHGALPPEGDVLPDLILTDQDFGEFYLRRRVVPDLLYDAARNFHLVLVGYTASDPPVRYLLDAISADDARFADLKPRFVFVPCKDGGSDEVTLADWEGRGLVPIPYSKAGNHWQLAATLERWADLFEKTPALGDGQVTVTERRVHETLERITEQPLFDVSDADRSLFDHLIRREAPTRNGNDPAGGGSSRAGTAQLASHLGRLRRDYEWLDRILEVIRGRVEDDRSGARPQDRPSGELERGAALSVQNFALERLEEKATITWARRLPLTDHASRLGLQRLLSRRANWEEALTEPWATAWQMVEESWRPVPYTDLDEARSASFEISRRLEREDRSLSLAERMAEFVTPSLQLNDPWESVGADGDEDHAPETWGDLFRAELRSVSMTELRDFDLAEVDDSEFLTSLIRALEAVLARGLDMGRWVAGKDDFGFLGLGSLQRVYIEGDVSDSSYEAVARGIAPASKLLHAAAEQLARVAPPKASAKLRRRFLIGHPVHRRLWAALAQNGCLVKVTELEEVLPQLTDRELWLPEYPEFSELLALRFGELDSKTQRELLARLRDGPQSELWPGVDADQAREWNLRSSLRQIKRIRDAGGTLPVEIEGWLDVNLAERPEVEADGVGLDFTSATEVGPDRVEPAWELDGYCGGELLGELEELLAVEEPEYRGGAGNWLEQRTARVFAAMEAERQTGTDLPHVWGAIGWRHRPPDSEASADSERDPRAEARQALERIEALSDETLAEVVEDLVRWWGNWQRHIEPGSLARQVWLRLWPHAVEATNAMPGEGALENDLGNTPAGVLASGATRLAPELEGEQRISQHSEHGEILAAIVNTKGRAGRVALAWLVCDVGWYLRVDPAWAERYLVSALKESAGPTKEHSESAITLWDTLGRLGLAGGVPRVLAADAMELIERADEPKLSAWSRQRLLSKLVWAVLRSFFHGLEPVVEAPELQQLLRRLDDEMRGWCATELWRCLVNHGDDSPEERFDNAVAPFLGQVWPKERSLVSRGVSHVMARIPAASRGRFVAAVDAVARYLVPGSVTSRHDYGLYGEEDDEPVLKVVVNTEEKAEALLRLLELTVGSGDDATTPWDLDELLVRIREVAPELVERPEFAQLTTMAQRSRFQ